MRHAKDSPPALWCQRLGFAALASVAFVRAATLALRVPPPAGVVVSCIVDAGSSGSRLHVFGFDAATKQQLHAPSGELDLVKKITPGLSSYGDAPASVLAGASGSYDALAAFAVDSIRSLGGDPAQTPATKAAIVRDLLNDRATAATRQVLEATVGRLHGQRLDAAIDTLCELAARQRERVVAEVRVAAPLTEEQSRRLASALSALKGRTVRLNVAIDSAILGGVMVTIGDEVIDGTVASRLEQARRAILG